MADLPGSRDVWTYSLELAAAGFAGSLGALVRLASPPSDRRLSWALTWEIAAGAAVGTLGWALAGTLNIEGWGQFLMAWIAGALGQAVVMDLAMAWARSRLRAAGFVLPGDAPPPPPPAEGAA